MENKFMKIKRRNYELSATKEKDHTSHPLDVKRLS